VSEPTLALTFQDLIIRVAEQLGVADYTNTVAAVPTDALDLERCKRRVIDGWRRFYDSNPSWYWCLQTFSITFDTAGTSDIVVDSAAWRYYMPDGFHGDMVGPLVYTNDDAPRIQILEATVTEILSARAASSHTGHPSRYALRPLLNDPHHRWEVVFYPTPGAADTVTGRCRVFPNMLIQLTDRVNCGPAFDEAVLAACKAEAEGQRIEGAVAMQGKWAEALVRAVASDRRSAPNNLGDYGPGQAVAACRPYTRVDTYTNMDGTVHTFG